MVKTYCSSCTKRCVGDVLKVGDKHFHIRCFNCNDCGVTLDAGGFFFRNNNYYCLSDYTNRFSNKCFICGNIISSEIVSALNRHFHRDCFKCDKCSNVFVPGNKVAMKNGKFFCSFCSFQNEVPNNIEENIINSSHKIKSADCETGRDVFSDDSTTDQGYMSADPTSLSSPTQVEEEHSKIQTLTEPIFKDYKSRSSTSRSLFDFGKFYRSSYLDIQEKQQNSHQLQSKKTTFRSGAKIISHNTSQSISSKRQIKTFCHNMGTLLNDNKGYNKPLGSVTEIPINEKENIIRLSSYPAGEKHPENIPYPIERDDWPAPLSTAILLQEKKKRRQNFFDNSSQSDLVQLPLNHVIDYTQSLDHLAVSSENHQKNLLEVITNNQRNDNDPIFNEDVISVSRSPNASIKPVAKPRFSNHTNKSKSRDSSYFNDPNRHIGYSLDFMSSTNRPFLVGSVPNNMYRKLTNKIPANHEVSLKFGYTKGMLYDQKINSNMKKPIFGECNSTTDNNININNNCNNHKNILHSVSNTAYSWTANRTMSDTFDVQLKNSEYDLTFDEIRSENVEVLTSSEIDIVTGLKVTRNKYSKERIKDPTLTSGRSSINSRIESLETWSFWSHKPGDGTKPPVIPYIDLISKNSKILKLLDIHKLETYLSDEEFQYLFKLSRFEFYKLPEWKQNDLKRRINLF